MRRQPVAFALIDAAFLADSKWRALRRRLPEPQQFNSALGAWLIVLTAARRNGLPEVNAEEEAEDPTYLPDLIAVGLLVETGIPDKPFRAWAPARPRYPSDAVTDAPKVTDAPGSPFPTAGSVSTPFPSTHIPKGPRAEKFNQPLIDEIRQGIERVYGSSDPKPPPTRLVTAAEQEREARRKEAFELSEQFQANRISEVEYQRRLRDIGKEPDDLTRAGA